MLLRLCKSSLYRFQIYKYALFKCSWWRICTHTLGLVGADCLTEDKIEHSLCLGDVGWYVSPVWPVWGTRGFARADLKFFPTRHHCDADAATLAERLHKWVLGHASVLPLVLHANLLQSQHRRRKDPVITLQEKRVRKAQNCAEGRNIGWLDYSTKRIDKVPQNEILLGCENLRHREQTMQVDK